MAHTFLKLMYKSLLLLPANEVWGKVIFSVACVKNSVQRGRVPGQVHPQPPGQVHPLAAATAQTRASNGVPVAGWVVTRWGKDQ